MKALGEGLDVRRGTLIGFEDENVDFSTYWLNPGTKDATITFVVAMEF